MIGKEKARRIILQHVVIAAVLFLIQRGVATFWTEQIPAQLAVRTAIKGLVTLTITVLCARTGKVGKDRAVTLLFAGLLLCVAGDVLLNYFFIPGMAVFALGHILFCCAFMAEKKPQRKQVLIWSCAVVCVAAAVFALKGYLGALAMPVLLYGAVLTAMVTFSYGYNLLMFLGAVLFTVSDAMTATEQVAEVGAVFEFILLGLYYAGVLLMAIAPWKKLMKE